MDRQHVGYQALRWCLGWWRVSTSGQVGCPLKVDVKVDVGGQPDGWRGIAGPTPDLGWGVLSGGPGDNGGTTRLRSYEQGVPPTRPASLGVENGVPAPLGLKPHEDYQSV